MSRQAWAFLTSLAATVLSIAALLRGRLAWVLVWAVVAAASWMAARRWNQESPTPFPHVLRWFLRLPRPFHSPARLLRILQPRAGERLLEIGPGIGTHSFPIASSLAPDGILDLLDVQREMLDQIRRRARKTAITNIASTQGDATRLPYSDDAFDGAYLIGVLGEIPDGDAALRELWRVLKPHGRLVVGEFFIDPDFSPLGSLERRVTRAGFALQATLGFALVYFARFQRG